MTCSAVSPAEAQTRSSASILGGLSGGGAGKGGGMGGLLGGLLPMVGKMLAGGGLQKVLAGFQENGLAEQAGSWLGTGANEPISGDDVRKVVGSEELTKIAGQLGISEDEAASALAQVLPAVVDKVSPDGQLPPAGELDAALGQLGDTRDGMRARAGTRRGRR